MPIYTGGNVIFQDAEWDLFLAKEAEYIAKIKNDEDMYASKLIENAALSNENSILKQENQLDVLAVDTLTTQVATLLSDIADLISAAGKPVAVAFVGQNQGTGQVLTLYSDGSHDPGGRNITYLWSITAKPVGSASTLVSSVTSSTSFTPDVAGNYTVNLVVNNSITNSTASTLNIAVAYVNHAPVANAGTQTSKLIGTIVYLNGSGSYDPDGDALFYAWTISTKPIGSIATLSNPSVQNPTFAVDLAGSYTVTLTVSDGFLANTSSISFLVSTTNLPPISNAGPGPLAATVGTLITLDGTGSSDPNGDPLTYSWVMTSKPGGSASTLALNTTVYPTFTPDVVGAYVVTLTVSDGSLTNASALTINAAAVNTAPTARITAINNALTGVLLNLSGSTSSDPQGSSLTYLWTLTTLPVGSTAALSSTTIVNPTLTPDVAGSYTLRLIVNDGQLSSASTTLSFNASTTNLAPVANAGTGGTLTIGSTIQLSGAASNDPNNDLLTYAWTIPTKPVGSTATLSNAAIVNPTFIPDVIGTYVFSLIVNDGLLSSVASTVSYTVNTVINRAPIAVISVNPLTASTGSPVALNGSSSYDPDSNPISYMWTLAKPAGSASTIVTPTAANTTFTPDVAGTYTVSLSVNDGLLSSAPVSATITVVVSTILFYDNFESGLVQQSDSNAYGWGSTNGFVNTGSGDSLAISADIAHSGTHSLKFTFAGVGAGVADYAWAEMNYHLGQNMQDVYLQWYQYYPNGTESPSLGPKWKHRAGIGQWGNNKWFKLWDDNYTNYHVATGISTINDTNSNDLFFVEYGAAGLPGGVDGHGALPNFLADDTYLGRWLKIQVHVKCATAANNDGAIEMWVNDVRVMSNTNLPLYPTGGIGSYLRNGYLMGYFNSGMDATSSTYIDEFKISATYIP